MTILDHTGAAALQRSQIVAALERADANGVSEAELKELGGNYWHNRLVELRRDGYVIGEMKGIFELVVGPSAGQASDPVGQRPTEDVTGNHLANMPRTLFKGEPRPHWDEAA